MSDEKKLVQLNCPGKKVPIRTDANIQAEQIRFACNGEKLEVFAKTQKGFFKLVDGSGFINKATKGVEWIDVPEEPSPPLLTKNDNEINDVEQQFNNSLSIKSKENHTLVNQNESLNLHRSPPPPPPRSAGSSKDDIPEPPAVVPNSSIQDNDNLIENHETKNDNHFAQYDSSQYEYVAQPEKPAHQNLLQKQASATVFSKVTDSTPKCALCAKSVYTAEKVQAINRIWHKTCFTCGGSSNEVGCKKVLQLTTYLSHGDDPFCKACHGRLFGPKGFGYGGAAQPAEVISVNNTARSAGSDKPDITEGVVSEEEQFSTPKDDTVSPRPAASIGQMAKTPVSIPKFGAAPKCVLCATSVFPAEKTQAINRVWHKTCFKCGGTSSDGGCGKVLTLDKYLSHGDDPFCKPCHTKLFGNKGFIK